MPIAPKAGAPTGVCIYPCRSGALRRDLSKPIAPKAGAPTGVCIYPCRSGALRRDLSKPIAPKAGAPTGIYFSLVGAAPFAAIFLNPSHQRPALPQVFIFPLWERRPSPRFFSTHRTKARRSHKNQFCPTPVFCICLQEWPVTHAINPAMQPDHCTHAIVALKPGGRYPINMLYLAYHAG
jgi:hypothetical protein